MPRKPRVHSSSGIYHVMLRGINRSDIFLDEVDCLKMEKILMSITKHSLCKIYAYCIMTNHIHLLMAELDVPISDVVKSIGVSYVRYFNVRRERTGPLFEGRFRSEPVDDCDYFITLLSYIHYNPVKAGMVSRPGFYKWSSWHEYELPEHTYNKGICEQSIPFKNLTREQVAEIVLNAQEPRDFCSVVDNEQVDYNQAVEIVNRLRPKEYSEVDLQELPRVVKLEMSVKAIDYGVTYSQLVSILGLYRSSIYRRRLKYKQSGQNN